VYEGPVQELIDELAKLPGVGPRGAQRIAFHLLSVQPSDIDRLTHALTRVRNDVRYCEVCGNVSAEVRCRICSDARRDAGKICVVEEPKDVQAVERTREFDGLYHVLGGALNPIKGIGADKLRIRELLLRIGGTAGGVEVTEVIIASDPDTEGEATAAYLVRMLRDFPGLTVTRPASGLPMGGELEFADELTLGRAMSGRRALSEPPRVLDDGIPGTARGRGVAAPPRVLDESGRP
jgi:recombination protein RecR